jgi:hypothetical protein
LAIPNIKAFRNHYPAGNNYIVANNVDRPFQKNYSGLFLYIENVISLIEKLTKDASP